MKCPHCDHKTGLVRFAMTVMNPWKIRCPKCSGRYSIGKKGNTILLIGALVGAGVGIGIYDKSVLTICIAGCVLGLLLEYLIWAMDEPVRK